MNVAARTAETPPTRHSSKYACFVMASASFVALLASHSLSQSPIALCCAIPSDEAANRVIIAVTATAASLMFPTPHLPLRTGIFGAGRRLLYDKPDLDATEFAWRQTK
jgi:hypothetical protein